MEHKKGVKYCGCPDCNAKRKVYRSNNKDKTRAINLRQSHNISVEEYDRIFERQDGLCAICLKDETHRNQFGPIPLAVDHDRTCCPGDKSCGKCIRGLLCHKCNTAEGLLKDPELARRLTNYMETNTRLISVYQCGPMDQCSFEEMTGWREELKKNYPEIKWLDPCERSYMPQQWRQLVEDDIADIDAADFVLAYYWKPGTGSAMELAYAHYSAKKPSIVVVPDFKKVSPWTRFHASYLVEDFDQAIKIIKANW